MDHEKLQAVQRPIKSKYQTEGQAARHVLKAQGRVDQEALVCHVETPLGVVAAGLHAGCGGSGEHACSANMLLDALVGCTGVTVAAVTTAMRIPVRASNVEAFGDLDFRGTLGVDKSVPVGFIKIRVLIELDCDASEEQLAKIASLTERYCVVYQSLAGSVEIETECRRLNA